jgi:isopentenyl phosphate kinase
MPDLYIIKLGGSVITEKEGNRFEVKRKAIARIASEIRKAMDEKGFSLIVVHGAGPFGHINVTNYGIDNGVFDERQREGYEKTVKDCNFLDSVVVEELRKAGIEAIGIDPNKIVKQDNRKIIEFETAEIDKVLKEGKVPVLFGQMVPDKKLNYSVMSGDAAIGFLAKRLKAKKIFLGTDVAGIFEQDPKKNPEAKRIEVINRENFDKVLERVGEAGTVDVTKGMKGKLEKLRETLQGTTALIFDAKQEGAFYKALVGEKVQGTEVRL